MLIFLKTLLIPIILGGGVAVGASVAVVQTVQHNNSQPSVSQSYIKNGQLQVPYSE